MVDDQYHYSLMFASSSLLISHGELEFCLRYPKLCEPLFDEYNALNKDYSFIDTLRSYYQDFRRKATPKQRLEISAEAIFSCSNNIGDMVSHASNASLHEVARSLGHNTDEYIFGYLAHMIGPSNKKAIRRLSSKDFVKRQALKNERFVRSIEIIKEIVSEFIQDCHDVGVSYSYAIENYGYRNSANRALDQANFKLNMQNWVDGSNNKLVEKKIKKKAKSNLKSLSKARTMLEMIAGKPTANAFFNNQDIKVEGDKFNFVFQKGSDYFGHSSISTILEDKNGVVLSNLCVYFEDTPSAEQLVSMMAHIQNGEEDKIIQAANLFGFKKEGLLNPDLERIVPKKIERQREIINRPVDCNLANTLIGNILDEVKWKSDPEHARKIRSIIQETSKKMVQDYVYSSTDIKLLPSRVLTPDNSLDNMIQCLE